MPVATVLGDVDPDDLGLTLSHEHLFIDLTNQFAAPSAPDAFALGLQPVGPEHAALLRDNPYALRDNLCLSDMDLALDELSRFARAGGRTVVDCTSIGIGRDPVRLRDLSLRSGLHILAGCGYYTQDTHPPELADWSEARIAQQIIGDLTVGIGATGIRAGIIGEIGTSNPIHADEEKVLAAAARAYAETGVAVQIHTYPWATHGLRAAELLIQRQVEPTKIVICHTDVELSMDYIKRLLDLGVTVQFDNLGKEFTLRTAGAGFAAAGFASDVQRVAALADLVQQGYERQLLMTNDICLKCLMRRYGGNGYEHTLANIAPRLRVAGVSDAALDTMLRDNPRRMLAAGRSCSDAGRDRTRDQEHCERGDGGSRSRHERTS